ncbi:MAG: hypothetical protein R6W70_08065 [bacterium]
MNLKKRTNSAILLMENLKQKRKQEMTRRDSNTLIDAVKIVEEFGFDGLEKAVAILLNKAMKTMCTVSAVCSKHQQVLTT